jgi:hypothetical protein
LQAGEVEEELVTKSCKVLLALYAAYKKSKNKIAPINRPAG